MKKKFALTILTAALTLVIGCSNTNKPNSISEGTNEPALPSSTPSSITTVEPSEDTTENMDTRSYSDEVCDTVMYFDNNGNFNKIKEDLLTQNNLNSDNLIEDRTIVITNSNIHIELYYKEDLDKYYFIEETSNYITFAQIKQITDHFNYLNEIYDSIVVPNPYSYVSIEGETGEKYVSQYRETKESDSNNNIINYTSFGVLNDYPDDSEAKILENIYEYNNDQILTHWVQYQNPVIWGTQFSTRNYYCDDKGNPIYLNAYITHGGLSYYYIYNGQTTPQYVILIDGFFGGVNMCKYPG